MRKVTNKAYEITDAKISFVSLVDKAANLRKFLITKEADGKASFTTCGRIVKTDAANHYVTGIVYEPMTEDSHGNYMTEEEIVKACYWYSENGDKVDLQHSFEPLDGCSVVENWVAKADFKVGDEEVKKGTWLMTVKVTDGDVWKGIENGEITGLSMGGIGNYSEEDVELDSVSKGQKTSEKKGLLKQLGAALGFNVVEKGAMAELYEERSKGTLFWDAFNTLQEVLYSYDNITGRWRYESDEGRVRECLEEFNSIITDILTGGKGSITKAIEADRPVEKAGKAMSNKNRETLQGIYESLGVFLEAFKDPDPEEEKPDDEEKPEGEETTDGDGETDDKGKADKDEKKSGGKEIKKEEHDMTKQEVEQIVSAAIAKAMGGNAQQAQATEGNTAATEITPEAIEKMVQAAVEKALTPQEQEVQPVTAEQVQEMITAAVAKAVDPVLKSKGLPSNLNGDGSVEKAAGEEHYLHGIL